MKLTVNLGERSYDISIGSGILGQASKYFNLNRRALIVTDSGVPAELAEAVLSQVGGEAKIHTVAMGEGSKSLDVLKELLLIMSDMKMNRGDCVVAVGGGVVGDLAGFAASVYMRGIDFYNVPTTLLAMVDSSIGGKTAVNLGGIKNIVGSFHQPSGVLVDTAVLKTLDARLLAAGLCEAIKMAATSDVDLFKRLEVSTKEEIYGKIDEIIYEALKIKKAVVEADEREGGLRKILNFGHTLGHGIEAVEGGRLYHGECVALGMLPACSQAARDRLIPVLKKFSLPTEYAGDIDAALEYASHDKKSRGDGVELVTVEEIGNCAVSPHTQDELRARVETVFCK